MRAVYDTHERELREKSEGAVEKARDIQFDEYARRLGDLNHAHELERQRNAESVTRVEFAQFKDDLSERTSLAAKEQMAKHEQVIASVGDLGDRFEARLKTEIDRINISGPAAYREAEAQRLGRETATSTLLATGREAVKETGVNRRWIVGLAVVVGLGVLAELVTIAIAILKP